MPKSTSLFRPVLAGGAALCLWGAACPLPAATLVVNANSPQGTDSGPGTEAAPFKTISKAAALAKPGDTVLVHAGTYRERVAPAVGGEEEKPVTYQAAPGEKVVVKGSEVWQPAWQAYKAAPDVYSGTLGSLFPSGSFNPFLTKMRGDVGKKSLGQLFVDGALYWEANSEEEVLGTAGTWRAADDGASLIVHFQPGSALPPDKRLVEVTVRNRIFAPVTRGLGYIVVDGFVFEHCANQFPGEGFWASDSPQAGAVSVRGGHHWIIRNNVIRWATGYGLDCGTEGKYDTDGKNQPEPNICGYHLVADNVVSDNGAGGIGAYRSPFTRIVGNVIERNNYMNSNQAYEDAGIKTHFFIHGLIENNLIRDNETSGIWLDNVYQGSRVTRNVVLNNKRAGIFCEMGSGSCLVDDNVVAYTHGGDSGISAGIYTHDASGVTVAHNLLYGNELFGLYMRYMVDRPINLYPDTFKDFRETPLQIEPSACSHQRILNNIFVANARGAISLIFPGKLAVDNRSDSNLFITTIPFERQYVINQTAGGSPDEVVKAYGEALAKQGRDAGKAPALVPYPEGFEVMLDQWRAILGNDLKSVVVNNPDATHTLNATFPEFSLKINDSLAKTGCEPVPGVDRDFLGNPIDPARVVPGPFQNLKPGKNVVTLWRRIAPKNGDN